MSERRRWTRPATPSRKRDQPPPGESVGGGESTRPTRPSPSPPTSVEAVVTAAGRPEREPLTAETERTGDTTSETYERIPLGFVALDHEQHITYANLAVLALVGASLTEVIGRRPSDVFPEPVGTRFQAAAVRTSAGVAVEYQAHFAPHDQWVDVLACPTQTGVAVFLRDISANRRAEEAARESEALLRGSLDAMLDPFVICSSVCDEQGMIVDFRVDFANRAAGAFLGRAPDTLIGALLPDWVPDLRGAPFSDACRTVVESGEAWTEDAVEYAIPGPDGDVMRGAANIQIAMFDDGFFAAWRDVTERERLAAVVEQMIDGVIIADAEGIVTYANPAFLAANGLTLEEVVGRPAATVAGELVGPAAGAALEQAALATEPWLQEIDHTSPDGTARHLALSLTPVRNASGTVTSYVVVSRDITELREAEAELDLQARVRAVLAESLNALPRRATLEQTAQAICDGLVTLPFIALAAVEVFLGATDVQIVGLSAPEGYPSSVGDHLPAHRAALVRGQVAAGPWAEYVRSSRADGGWMARIAAAGLTALAYGPIGQGDQVMGTLMVGTLDERFARTLVEKLPALVAFSATSSALLAERLRVMRREEDLRGALAAVLAARAFHLVFQPIVDLESGDMVGYEALTRFDSGQRPDLCFADAWSVGLGPALEIATLEAAVAEAKRLPPGRWLDLNLSPRLLVDPARLRAVLWSADRPILLEITEHEAVEDYGAVREAIAALGHDVRLAVDDAGAGVANFGHIIELRPDFVKLDISLVRRVNADLGRQAMVVGMRHFSRTAGCRLVAEGIETDEEARTLTGLGVAFGQGYLFGHPEPVEVWAAAEAAGRDRGHPVSPADPGSEAHDRHS
ncbi:MAG: EAL domain-containing protein [Candidatus Limnocylindrales bacterium]